MTFIRYFRPSQAPAPGRRGRELPEGWEDAFRLLHGKGWTDVRLGMHFGRSAQWACQTRTRLGLLVNLFTRGFAHDRARRRLQGGASPLGNV